jgi:subtilisin family serine protease
LAPSALPKKVEEGITAMKKYLLFSVSLLFVSLLFTSSTALRPVSARPQRPQFATGRLLVKYRAQVEDREIERDITERMSPAGRSQVESLHTNALGKFYVVKLPEGVSVEEAGRVLSQSPDVEYAEPDYYLYPSETTPDDPLFTTEWGMFNSGPPSGKAGADINAPKAWDISTGSDDVVAAVIDTGVQITHKDLAANVWVNPGEIPGNGADDDSNGYIDDINGWNFFDNNNQVFDPVTDQGQGSHGTHVAGTIGAVGNNGTGVAGVAWHVKLMVLKFIGPQPDGSGYNGKTSDAIKSINYVITERKRGINVRVINASWDGRKNAQGLHDAIAAAGQAGIVFVCAAGNGNIGLDNDVSPVYPAAWNDIPSLISVSALDDQDNLAYFSYFGHQTVGVGAPGVNVMSTLPIDSYGQNSGTSMASPHVAGIAVLLAAHEPSLSPDQIVHRIITTAKPVVTLASKTISSGMADAFNALTNQVADPGSPEIAAVATTKKVITVDGIGFRNGTAVVEAGGVSLGSASYDSSFALPNGTITELSVRIGKALMKSTFPPGVPVQITVFNPTTGERSSPFTYTN